MAFFSSCARGNRSSAEHIWITNAPVSRGVCDPGDDAETKRLEHEGNVAVSDAFRDDASHLIDLASQALDGIAHDRVVCEPSTSDGMNNNLEDLRTEVPDVCVLDEKSFERTKQNDAHVIKPVVFMGVLGIHQASHRFLAFSRREYDQDFAYWLHSLPPVSR